MVARNSNTTQPYVSMDRFERSRCCGTRCCTDSISAYERPNRGQSVGRMDSPRPIRELGSKEMWWAMAKMKLAY